MIGDGGVAAGSGWLLCSIVATGFVDRRSLWVY
jgi:hypothetical protein